MSKKQKPGLTIRDESSEFLLYSTDSGTVKVEVLLGQETVWLTINRMAGLFGVDKSTVSRHLKNIYESGELEREATVAKIATVQIEGEREVTQETKTLTHLDREGEPKTEAYEQVLSMIHSF